MPSNILTLELEQLRFANLLTEDPGASDLTALSLFRGSHSKGVSL